MKKKVFILAAIAGLAISAIAVSCSKTEAEQDQHSLPEVKRQLLHFTPTFFWADPMAYGACLEYDVSTKLCFMGMSSNVDNYPSHCLAIIANGEFECLEIRAFSDSPISKNAKIAIEKAIAKGFIVFDYDCPVDDDNLLAVLNNNYLPAGSYPISREGDTVIIRIMP